jgi:hypothetical protein
MQNLYRNCWKFLAAKPGRRVDCSQVIIFWKHSSKGSLFLNIIFFFWLAMSFQVWRSWKKDVTYVSIKDARVGESSWDLNVYSSSWWYCSLFLKKTLKSVKMSECHSTLWKWNSGCNVLSKTKICSLFLPNRIRRSRMQNRDSIGFSSTKTLIEHFCLS